MWPIDNIKEWLVNVTVKKGLRAGVGVIVAFLTSGVIAVKLQEMGIEIDKTQLELALLALISAGLEMLRTWLKNKMGVKFL